MIVKAIRGAIQIKKDSIEAIDEGVATLAETIIEKNGIIISEIVYIHFTSTKDLVARNPATALRQIGFENTPLFCSQEPEINGSLPMVIRVLITLQLKEDREINHIYLRGAQTLRPEYRT